MKKFFRGFDLVIDVLMILCSVGFVTLAFAQVVCRFVLNSSLTWSEELCRYLFVEWCFWGLACASLKRNMPLWILSSICFLPGRENIIRVCWIFL